MCQQISKVSSSIILHAIVNHYNWDDGPESMIAALNNPVCAGDNLYGNVRANGG
ncbi:DUF4274 domain-containing protein [Lysinibacillus fusiformis]|uniref:DUF4274 domain-containing protein n=1 Tax=Lysinibacillus fusiformis TaxID=28031 RepID=UPI00215A8CC9|nr:DUF4274 domain-containing protein [Lysinibacillus fusiformis]MCR8853544.1 DUF4274 domain-containing protein [Lysinibacillus fusiformis]